MGTKVLFQHLFGPNRPDNEFEGDARVDNHSLANTGWHDCHVFITYLLLIRPIHETERKEKVSPTEQRLFSKKNDDWRKSRQLNSTINQRVRKKQTVGNNTPNNAQPQHDDDCAMMWWWRAIWRTYLVPGIYYQVLRSTWYIITDGSSSYIQL